jgi:hypothetical protein
MGVYARPQTGEAVAPGPLAGRHAPLARTCTIMRAKLWRLRRDPRMPWTSTAVGTLMSLALVKRTMLPCSSSQDCHAGGAAAGG